MTTIDDKVEGVDINICTHDRVYIIGVETQEPEFAGHYWYNCVKCDSTMLGLMEDYQMTTKLYDNSYIIYQKPKVNFE